MEVPSHITPPDGIEFKRSEMDPTQMGAWCTKPIPRETFLGPFVGDIIRDGDESGISYRYAWEIFNLENGEYLYTINATDPTVGNWMRYVNCARYLEEQNLVSVQKDMEMFYKAIKDIEPGEELLTWYQPFRKRRKKKMRSPLKNSGRNAKAIEMMDEGEATPSSEDPSQQTDNVMGVGKRQRVKKKMFDDIILMSDLIPKRRRRSKAEMLADKEENDQEPTKKRRKSKNLEEMASVMGDNSVETDDQGPKSSQGEKKKRGRKKSVDLMKKIKNSLTDSQSDLESTASSESIKPAKSEALFLKPKTAEEKKQIAEIEAAWKYPTTEQEFKYEHLVKNALTKNGRNVYKCDVCSGIYRHTFSLKRHFLRNHINCRYLSRTDLVNCLVVPAHQWLDIKHANEEAVLKKCDEKLDSGTPLVENFTESSDVSAPGLYRCCICNKLFDTLQTLTDHTQDHPATPHEKFFGCDQCKMRFTFHQNLLRHKLVHEDSSQKVKKKNKNFVPKSMGHFNQDDIHGKPFKCRLCPMKFRYQTNLEKHHKIHTTERSFDCSICGKLFPSETNLKKHMVFHVGSTVSCQYCVRSVSHVGMLRKHIRLDHPLIHKQRLLKMIESKGKGDSETAANLRKEIKQLEKQSGEKNSNKSETSTVKNEGKIESKTMEENAVEPDKTVENAIKLERIEASVEKSDVVNKPGRFKFVCVVCKKRFSAYVNMCRHRRMAHKDFKSTTTNVPENSESRSETPKSMTEKIKKTGKSEKVLRLKDSVKKQPENPVEETPESVQEFYANVASNIADNLNSYLDGGAEAMSNYKSYINIEDYDSWEPLIREEVPSEENNDFKWERFNFPPNYSSKLVEENFQYIDQKLEDEVKVSPAEKYDKKILEELAPALCTRRRSSSEWIALAEFSKGDNSIGNSPLAKENKPSEIENISKIEKTGNLASAADQTQQMDIEVKNDGNNSKKEIGKENVTRKLDFEQTKHSSHKDKMDRKDNIAKDEIDNEQLGQCNDKARETDGWQKEKQNIEKGDNYKNNEENCLDVAKENDISSPKSESDKNINSNEVNKLENVVEYKLLEGIGKDRQEIDEISETDKKQSNKSLDQDSSCKKQNCLSENTTCVSENLKTVTNVLTSSETFIVTSSETSIVTSSKTFIVTSSETSIATSSENPIVKSSETSSISSQATPTCITSTSLDSQKHISEPANSIEELSMSNLSELHLLASVVELHARGHSLTSRPKTNTTETSDVKHESNEGCHEMDNQIKGNGVVATQNTEQCEKDEKNKERTELKANSKNENQSEKETDKKDLLNEGSGNEIRNDKSNNGIEKTEQNLRQENNLDANKEGKSNSTIDNVKEVSDGNFKLDANQLIEKLVQEVKGQNENTLASETVKKEHSEEKSDPQNEKLKSNIFVNKTGEITPYADETREIKSENSVDNESIPTLVYEVLHISGEISEKTPVSPNTKLLDTRIYIDTHKMDSGAKNEIGHSNNEIDNEKCNELGESSNQEDREIEQIFDKKMKTENQNNSKDNDCDKSMSSGVMSLDLFSDSDNEDIFTGLALSKKCLDKNGEEVKLFDIIPNETYTQLSPFHNFEEVEFGKYGTIVNVCSVCKRHFEDTERLLRHQWKKHPSIHCHYLQVEHGHEIEYLFYSQPCNKGVLGMTGKVFENINDRGSYTCTRCNGSFKSVERLRIHIINCAPKQEEKESKEIIPYYRKRYRKHRKIIIKSDIDSPVKVKKEVTPEKQNRDVSKHRLINQATKTINIPDPIDDLSMKGNSRKKKSGEMVYNPMNHVRRREFTEVLDTHQCKGCGVKFNSISLLERHVKKCDGKDKFKDLKVMKSNINDTFHQKLKHTCLYCNRGFSYPKTLMNHYKAFCLVKKDKVSKGQLTDFDKQQEYAMMLKLKQQEEDRCFTDIPDENGGARKGWPRGMKRKWRRKNHCWTYIKKKRPSTDDKVTEGQSEVNSDEDENELSEFGNDEEEKVEEKDNVIDKVESKEKNKAKEKVKKSNICKQDNKKDVITEKGETTQKITTTPRKMKQSKKESNNPKSPKIKSPKKLKGNMSTPSKMSPKQKRSPKKSEGEKSQSEDGIRQKRKYIKKKIFTFDEVVKNKRGRKKANDSVQTIIDNVATCQAKEESSENVINSDTDKSHGRVIKNRVGRKRKIEQNEQEASLKTSPVAEKKGKMSTESNGEKVKKKGGKYKVKVKTNDIDLTNKINSTTNNQQNITKAGIDNGQKDSKHSERGTTPKVLFHPQKRLRKMRKELAKKLDKSMEEIQNNSMLKEDFLKIKSDIVKSIDQTLKETMKTLGIPDSNFIDEDYQNSLTKSQRMSLKKKLKEVHDDLSKTIEGKCRDIGEKTTDDKEKCVQLDQKCSTNETCMTKSDKVPAKMKKSDKILNVKVKTDKVDLVPIATNTVYKTSNVSKNKSNNTQTSPSDKINKTSEGEPKIKKQRKKRSPGKIKDLIKMDDDVVYKGKLSAVLKKSKKIQNGPSVPTIPNPSKVFAPYIASSNQVLDSTKILRQEVELNTQSVEKANELTSKSIEKDIEITKSVKETTNIEKITIPSSQANIVSSTITDSKLQNIESFDVNVATATEMAKDLNSIANKTIILSKEQDDKPKNLSYHGDETATEEKSVNLQRPVNKIPIYNQEFISKGKKDTQKVLSTSSQQQAKTIYLKPVDNEMKKKLEEAGHVPQRSYQYVRRN